MSIYAVHLSGITKRYGSTVANDRIDLRVTGRSIHGILGENGAGKSTLMKILFGSTRPDSGSIRMHGKTVEFTSSADALRCRIGMVHQHYSMVDSFTVAENLLLIQQAPSRWRQWWAPLTFSDTRTRVRDMSRRFGFGIDPDARCADLSVGARQKVEILKALWSGATTLVLDEPTAALSPPEADELYALLERLREDGATIILISHKLPEIMRLCDRVTVLRHGRVVGERDVTRGMDANEAKAQLEADLVRLMIGSDRPEVPERVPLALPTVLQVRDLGDESGLGPMSFTVQGGEIVAVVGVEGNGQGALVDALVGTGHTPTRGSVILDGVELAGLSTRERFQAGLAHIPEDRHAHGVAADMSLIDNASIGYSSGAPFAPTPLWLSKRRRRRLADTLISTQHIRTAGADGPLSRLSGGNQQKLVVGRELARSPRLMIAAQPTRGLDIAAASAVHRALVELRAAGSAILLLSLDLAEVFAVSDRIVVIRNGRLVGETLTCSVDSRQLGGWMSGAGTEEQAA